ncbi:MAG: response regulator transcription factor [Anaerolineae bacterium]
MITVVVVDDHPVVRAGMQKALDAAADISVVAEGASGAQALRLVDRHRPDVLLLDVRLPDLSGVEICQRLHNRAVDTAILILTAYDDARTVFGLLERGASGYVLKDEALEILVSAVRAAAGGETWLSPAVASQVVSRAVGDVSSESTESSPFSLTPRETEVLRLLAQGLDNASIAECLVVTKRTVQNHVSNIYAKLGTASRTEAALWAIGHGLADVPPTVGTGDEG